MPLGIKQLLWESHTIAAEVVYSKLLYGRNSQPEFTIYHLEFLSGAWGLALSAEDVHPDLSPGRVSGVVWSQRGTADAILLPA